MLKGDRGAERFRAAAPLSHGVGLTGLCGALPPSKIPRTPHLGRRQQAHSFARKQNSSFSHTLGHKGPHPKKKEQIFACLIQRGQ